jgi:predicted MPP superfamily phosphohydrolase
MARFVDVGPIRTGIFNVADEGERMSLGVAGIVLGGIAIILDLGNRLFGSYARTPAGAAWRIAFVVLVCVALASPGVLILLDPASKAARLGVNLCGVLGALAFVHFLFPYRWGIKRVQPHDSEVEITALTEGIVLCAEVWRSPAIPDAADGLSLLVISDLHCNTTNKLQMLRESIAAVTADPVDLAFALGDFGEDKSLLPEVVCALRDIPSRLGTFCVRGNHDFEHGRETLVRELLADNGLTLLPNEAKHLHQIDTVILGVEGPWSKDPLPDLPSANFIIGLAHTPDSIAVFRKLGVNLGFAGHTHGGKISLPMIGSILVPSKYGRFLDARWFVLGDSLMYVTPGLGYFPGCTGNLGELFRLTLQQSRRASRTA